MLDIKQNVSLRDLNTFHIDICARYFVEIRCADDIYQVLDSDIYRNNVHFILWWWANVLFKSDFNGLIIKVCILWTEIIREDQNEVIIKVWAWENRHQFVMQCVENNYGLIENLVYIPWTVWACPVQNIWAYGADVSQSINHVFGINLDSKTEIVLNNAECKFSERNSIFKDELKNKFLITHVSFKLKKVNSGYKLNSNYKDVLKKIKDSHSEEKDLSIKDIANIIMEIRKDKLPDRHQLGNAWSFFQNPIISKEKYLAIQKRHSNLVWFDIDQNNIKLSAGQLIEICGFKWCKIGDAWVYINHALVLVNYDKAKWEDIANLAKKIQDKVNDDFDIKLIPEVNYVW